MVMESVVSFYVLIFFLQYLLGDAANKAHSLFILSDFLSLLS